MKPTVLLVIVVLAGPPGAVAQLGVSGRVGTLGIGPEVSLELTDGVVLRGGVGLSGQVASTSFDGVPVEIELPERWGNVGVDLYLNAAFRLGGGLLFKPKAVTLRGTFDSSVDLGGQMLAPQQVGTLTGRITSMARAPYALIGFGRHTAAGFGLSLDLGAAVLGTPSVGLDAAGGTYPAADLDALLDLETADFEDDMKTYLRIWPILSLGLRFGFG